MARSHKHHTLFYRAEWTARPDAQKVRQNRWLIPPLDLEVHDELHAKVPYVPSLGRYAMALIRRDFEPIHGDYVNSVYSLITTMDDVSKMPQTSRLETEAMHVAAHALEMQIPYIKQGLVLPEDH